MWKLSSGLLLFSASESLTICFLRYYQVDILELSDVQKCKSAQENFQMVLTLVTFKISILRVKASEIVMSRDRNNVSAILVKAESLYNTCFFEHGLILFHRGKALAPENEEFRLGIQKCHKTIGMDWFCPELLILTWINSLNLLKVVLRWIGHFLRFCWPKTLCIYCKVVHWTSTLIHWM